MLVALHVDVLYVYLQQSLAPLLSVCSQLPKTVTLLAVHAPMSQARQIILLPSIGGIALTSSLSTSQTVLTWTPRSPAPVTPTAALEQPGHNTWGQHPALEDVSTGCNHCTEWAVLLTRGLRVLPWQMADLAMMFSIGFHTRNAQTPLCAVDGTQT